ncbi:trypsin-like peptidase domain-containing protein [bacterium]|nr:trypsin-like peptidase domain-containing protein [bacterium]
MPIFHCSESQEQSEESFAEIATPLIPVNQLADDIQMANEDITQSRQNAITRAVARVNSAVVGINVTQILRVQQRSFWDNDPFYRYFAPPQSYREYEVNGLGSGFIISPDGYILTNQHVIDQASEIVVSMTNGEHVNAEVVGEDPKYDVALLKVDKNDLDYIPFGNSDDVIIGEWVIAIGNPFGLFDVSSKPTVTVGVVSATGMDFEGDGGRSYEDMIQTDAAINGGNSGGPLVNSLGQCIGINTLIYSGSSEWEPGTSIGIGFAIPINRVKTILPDLQKIGPVDQSFATGLEVENISRVVARMMGISQRDGVVVTRVSARSPAESAGMQVGDVIVAIGGERVRSTADVQQVINSVDIEKDRNLELTVFRDGKLYEVVLQL